MMMGPVLKEEWHHSYAGEADFQEKRPLKEGRHLLFE